jgi:hypothetical protein
MSIGTMYATGAGLRWDRVIRGTSTAVDASEA